MVVCSGVLQVYARVEPGCTDIKDMAAHVQYAPEYAHQLIDYYPADHFSVYSSSFVPSFAAKAFIEVDSAQRFYLLKYHLHYFSSVKAGTGAFRRLHIRVSTCLDGIKTTIPEKDEWTRLYQYTGDKNLWEIHLWNEPRTGITLSLVYLYYY